MYSKFYWQTSILLNKKTMQWSSKGKRVRNRLRHTTSWGTKPIWCHLIQAFWFFSQFFPFRKWMLGSYNQSNYWNLACNSCVCWVCPLLNCSWPQLFTRTPPSLTPPSYSFCSFSPHFLPSVQHLNHLLSIIPPEFLMPGTWPVFSKLELESNCEKLQLRCILESSFPRRNCFNPDNRYSNISYSTVPSALLRFSFTCSWAAKRIKRTTSRAASWISGDSLVSISRCKTFSSSTPNSYSKKNI